MTTIPFSAESDPGTLIPTEMPPPVMPPSPVVSPEIIELPPAEPALPVREPGTVIPAQSAKVWHRKGQGRALH